MSTEKKENPLDKYKTEIEPHFDLEAIKKAQNYQGIDADKMDQLTRDADIQEPIEELLKMI